MTATRRLPLSYPQSQGLLFKSIRQVHFFPCGGDYSRESDDGCSGGSADGDCSDGEHDKNDSEGNKNDDISEVVNMTMLVR